MITVVRTVYVPVQARFPASHPLGRDKTGQDVRDWESRRGADFEHAGHLSSWK
jgi:hypothetical protein